MVGRIEVFPRAGAAAARVARRLPMRTRRATRVANACDPSGGCDRIGGAHHVGVARQEDRVHPELAHAPGDELRVLAAVVEDDDGVGAGGANAALAARLLGGGRAHGVD